MLYKLNVLAVIFFAAMFFASCKNETASDSLPENKSVMSPEVLPNSGFSIALRSEPAEIAAGQSAKLIFTIKNDKGETVKDLPKDKEKLIHLLIVSDDLELLYHEHPVPDADGNFVENFTFQSGGAYKFHVTYMPSNAEQIEKDFMVSVSGVPREFVELKPDETFEKTVEGIKVVMKPDAEIVSGKELMFNFSIFDANTGELASGMQKYLGESAHFVVISQDLKDFLHAHPMSMDNVKMEKMDNSSQMSNSTKIDSKLENMPENSMVSAHITFPKPAIYRIWAQFQRNGKVITVPFTVNVKQGEAEKRLEAVEIPKGAFKIVVSKDGFTPEEVTFQKGQPLKLAFFRADGENCADEIVFKDLNIKKTLNVGEVVLIDIPTTKAGTINFACGMNMYKGKIVIE
jgi:hypothetical protein